MLMRGAVCVTEINAPASGYGSGFNRTPLTTLKTAQLAPTPRAMVSNVTTVNIGERIRRRTTCRISLTTVTIRPPAFARRRQTGTKRSIHRRRGEVRSFLPGSWDADDFAAEQAASVAAMAGGPR